MEAAYKMISRISMCEAIALFVFFFYSTVIGLGKGDDCNVAEIMLATTMDVAAKSIADGAQPSVNHIDLGDRESDGLHQAMSIDTERGAGGWTAPRVLGPIIVAIIGFIGVLISRVFNKKKVGGDNYSGPNSGPRTAKRDYNETHYH